MVSLLCPYLLAPGQRNHIKNFGKTQKKKERVLANQQNEQGVITMIKVDDYLNP